MNVITDKGSLLYLNLKQNEQIIFKLKEQAIRSFLTIDCFYLFRTHYGHVEFRFLGDFCFSQS